jgi:adenylate cyclase
VDDRFERDADRWERDHDRFELDPDRSRLEADRFQLEADRLQSKDDRFQLGQGRFRLEADRVRRDHDRVELEPVGFEPTSVVSRLESILPSLKSVRVELEALVFSSNALVSRLQSILFRENDAGFRLAASRSRRKDVGQVLPPDVSLLHRWLVEEPQSANVTGFVRALAAQMTLAGFPVWRLTYALMTKHPEVLWRTIQWRAAEGVTVRDQPHSRLQDEYYTRSPVALVRRSGSTLRVRLTGEDPVYPICRDLRDAGGTDYCVQALPFTNGQTSYVSFATRAAGGFSSDALESLDALRPFLARRIELESAYYATAALLEVYLGRNAARRVLAGEFQRGRGELIDAAIWFSDMRGFTSMTDGTPPARVVEVLDATFDTIASAIAANGGEVLKFIGDAVMAIFPVGDDPGGACRRAVHAAKEALAALDASSEGRRARREPAVAIGIGLHRGEVMYGNIGARDRLDFTVISSAVNEAARLESLSKSLKTPLAMSAPVAEAVPDEDLVDLGEHELKGVRAKLRVYTLRPLLAT